MYRVCVLICPAICAHHTSVSHLQDNLCITLMIRALPEAGLSLQPPTLGGHLRNHGSWLCLLVWERCWDRQEAHRGSPRGRDEESEGQTAQEAEHRGPGEQVLEG